MMNKPALTSVGWDGRTYALAHERTNQYVAAGAEVTSFRDKQYKLEGGRAPKQVSSQGEVWVSQEGGGGQTSFYPSVFGLRWVPLA